MITATCIGNEDKITNEMRQLMRFEEIILSSDDIEASLLNFEFKIEELCRNLVM